MAANVCVICEHSIWEHEDEGDAPCLWEGCSCRSYKGEGYEDEESDDGIQD